MNLSDRMPGPGPRGDRDGADVFHVIASLVGLALVVFVAVAVVILLWNSFKVRAELRALRNEVARLGGGGSAPGVGSAAVRPTAPGVNHGLLAVPPPPTHAAAPPAQPMPPVAPATAAPAQPTPPPVAIPPAPTAPKGPRAPRRKPTDAAE